jgi:hypothetical protein
MKYSTATLPELLREADLIAERASQTFGDLNYDQLNWKPTAERWSVAQCFDHLTTSNEPFLKIIDTVTSGNRKSSGMERVPLLPGLLGRLLIKSLDPSTTRKLKAPKMFEPATSDIPLTVLQDFIQLQKNLISKIQDTAHLDLEKIIITSPVSKAVAYSLMDAYRIIVVHEERHFQQAQRVTAESAFPSSAAVIDA